MCENHPPTRHIEYKVIDFAPSNKSIYRALIVPNWPKWLCLNPHNYTKNDQFTKKMIIFSNLSSEQQYLLNDKKKNSVKNGLLKSQNLSKEKNTSEHKYSVTFVAKVGTKVF